MEISLLTAVLSNISSFFRLSSDDNIKCEPTRKYYGIIEEILKLLKPVLSSVSDSDVAHLEPFQKAFKELSHSVNVLRDLFENWHPLRSKLYFVLEAETVISKVQHLGIEILELLKSSDQGLQNEFDVSVLEIYIQKFEQICLEQTSVIVNEAIREQEDNSEASSETLAKFTNSFSLKSNQELLIEAVALEKLKDNAEQSENSTEVVYYDQLISLVTHMHEQLVTSKQSDSSNLVLIPADFCCPLSLELMTDPVIVASGQTYERAFIRKWIDLGLTVCPKTRQTLSHTSLIPNYNLKALVTHWCETNNIKLPDPVKLTGSNLSPYLSLTDNARVSSKSTQSYESTRKTSVSSSGAIVGNGNSGELALESDTQSSNSPPRGERGSYGHSRNVSASSLSTAHNPQDNNIDVSGEQTSKLQAAINSLSPRRENEFPTRFQARSFSQSLFRRPIPQIVSSPAAQTSPDLSEVESQVKNLIENLKSTSIDEQRVATHELRLLAKHNMDNRIVIASCGAIDSLVNLLRSTDSEIQENAVTALLNLSINDNNKAVIADFGAIEPLIHVLENGTPEAKENSAATFLSLSLIKENKAKIGKTRAIKALVDMLGNGTPRGKKDASAALFNLSILHENKARIVQAGAVRYLVDLTDPAVGMVDKAVAVLANLTTIKEGRIAIGQEGGIPVLVEVVELGSPRGKENAAAALLQLCTSSDKYCNMVIHDDVVPPLVALSQSGTPRGIEKALALLRHFRNQRHVNAGRS